MAASSESAGAEVPTVTREVRGGAALPTRPRVVVIGNFDGVHRGHAEVIRLSVREATQLGAESSVLTFDPHPATVLGGKSPAVLTSLAQKVALLGELGVQRVVAQTFDRHFADQSPEQFVDTILVRGLSAVVVVVGHDFRFGKNRAGDLETLRTLAASRNISVEVHGVVSDETGPLSSTRVRKALAEGNVTLAATILGRPHQLEGAVVHGDARGRTLGFPTANLGEVAQALPAHGVYAVRVGWQSTPGVSRVARTARTANGVANVGQRPTVTQGSIVNVEVNLFDLPEADQDLYGRHLSVDLIQQIREERRFDGLDSLRTQIALDAASARQILERT